MSAFVRAVIATVLFAIVFYSINSFFLDSPVGWIRVIGASAAFFAAIFLYFRSRKWNSPLKK